MPESDRAVVRQEQVPPWTIRLVQTKDPAGWEVVTSNPTLPEGGEARQGHYLSLPEAEEAFARMVEEYQRAG